MARRFAWAILGAILLGACVAPAVPADQIGQQEAERLAREHMSRVVGTAAVERSRVEVRPSACGWMVVFRDAEARCGEAPFWPGACRFGAAVFRDVYTCVLRNRQIQQVGGSLSPQSLNWEDRCQCAPDGTSTVAPEPTAVPALSGAAPTPVPTQVAATPTPAGPLISPVVTGALILVDDWSLDGQWLAFWLAEGGASEAQLYPVMTLHFYNARTGETCNCPEFQSDPNSTRTPPLAWQDDGQIVVWDGATARRGTPCRGSFQPADAQAPPPVVQTEALSPGGSYRAATREEWQSDGTQLRVTTTFSDARSGQTLQVVEYPRQSGEGGLGLGGAWVTDHLFLIDQTLDHGPLLVDVQEGRVVEVISDLFGIDEAPAHKQWFWAWAQTMPDGETYHIVLRGETGPVRLYHSETGQAEQLELASGCGPVFSPDGRWLLMGEQDLRWVPGGDAWDESYALWGRSLDPPGSPAYLIAQGDCAARWSPDYTRLAVAWPGYNVHLPNVTSIYSFPEGRLLGAWTTGEYVARPAAWSPDGRWLAISGNIVGEWRDGLFIVEP